MKGWTGKILRVDLSNRTYSSEDLDFNTARMFLGGQGVATKILMDEMDPKVDPLSPENKLIFSIGPLTGTAAPLGSRYMVTSKSPLTGLLGFGNSGGFFGPAMRNAGYDHIVFEGKSKTPVYMLITDEEVEFRDASHIWGKDTHETEDIIRKETEDSGKRVRIAGIGPAGEKLVRMAAIMNDKHRAAARCGIGAVMGSKNLKALAVRGSKKVEVADDAALKSLAKEVVQKIRENPAIEGFTQFGTSGFVMLLNEMGILPTRNFQRTAFENAMDISGETLAEKYLDKIKATYDTPDSDLNDKTIFDHLIKSAPEGSVLKEEGDLIAGKNSADEFVEQQYLDGYVAHSPMEPHAALAIMENGRLKIWASTQRPFGLKSDIAKSLNLKEENVQVMQVFLGGGFGGKSAYGQAIEAARLAKLSGKPVMVAWTRTEEFFYDTYRPAAVVKINAGCKKDGSMTQWDYGVYFAGQRGAQHFYDIPNHKTTVYNSSWTAPGVHPFATGAWRAPSNNTNSFARESQINIMAAKIGMDPVEFRLKNLKDERMIRTLKTAVEKFGWNPVKSPSGQGYGIACGVDAGSYVALMTQVDVDRNTGKVQVNRVVVAQDMGLVINPQGATIQAEGCVTMGLGYALSEDIQFTGGQIHNRNFDSYELPKFSWVPKIEVELLDLPNEPAQGGGEPAIICMGALIGNAIYDAIGVRLNQLPMNPERILEALKA